MKSVVVQANDVSGCVSRTSELLERTFDNTGASLLVESLGITLLDLLERGIDKDLEEGDLGLFVDRTSECAVGEVGRDESGERRRAGRGDELRDLT